VSRIIEPYPHTDFPQRDSLDHLDALTINNVHESESHIIEYGIPIFSIGSSRQDFGTRFKFLPAAGWSTETNVFFAGNLSALSQEWVFVLPAGYTKYELVIDFRLRDVFPSGEITNPVLGGSRAGVLSVDIVPLANNSGGYVAGATQTIFKAFRDKSAFQAVNGIVPETSAADLSRFNGSDIHAFRVQDDLDSNLFLPNKARLMHFIFNIDYTNWVPAGGIPFISGKTHPITGQLIEADGLLAATLIVHK